MKHTTRATAASLTIGLAVTATALTGCSGVPEAGPPEQAGPVRLVAFDSCKQALRELKDAAKPYVGVYGFDTGGSTGSRPGGDTAAGDRAEAPANAPAAGAEAPGESKTAPDHSGTNNHEAGVDEPDLVKTDGKRVVTVTRTKLVVVDAAKREVTGELPLDEKLRGGVGGHLLLHGNRALVLLPYTPVNDGRPNADTVEPRLVRPRTAVLLVDLSSAPKLLSTMTVDGRYVDARMVDGRVQLVTHHAPRVPFARPQSGDPDTTLRNNRTALARSGIDDWLPRYQIESNGVVATGRVGCEHVSRPTEYTGTSMLTVMSLAITAKKLSGDDAVSIVADGRTVYGTGDHLYVANDRRAVRPMDTGAPVQPRTEIFKFDVSKPGVPKHVASGAVPGYLLNQYAMSEHDDHLRVATTSEGTVARNPDEAPNTESAVYVLGHKGSRLTRVGHVGGLGKGERIYAARFIGDVGYLVTFRQVDPLYVLDLRNPKRPKVTGELKITGYSAYLHPASGGRLIGVGQEASTQGQRQGLQVSLFDVSNPAVPSRLAQHVVDGATSAAEFDPHAFLYWPKTGLVVLPVNGRPRGAPDEPAGAGGGALVVRVDATLITEVGTLAAHSDGANLSTRYTGTIRRSIMIGDDLWTLSEMGLRVDDGSSLEEKAWIPFA